MRYLHADPAEREAPATPYPPSDEPAFQDSNDRLLPDRLEERRKYGYSLTAEIGDTTITLEEYRRREESERG